MLVGHRRNIRYFETALAKGTLAHAYLFHGPEAVGKRTVAMAVAQSLLCSGTPRNKLGGCPPDRPAPPELQRGERAGGGCEDCRLVSGGTHPDLIFLSFERLLVEEDLKRAIGIKNIHELQRRLALAPWRGERKVVLMDGADVLSREAQTALLKTLEEPQSTTTFFLISDRPDGLLPTIRSRSVPMGFAPVADDEMAPLLKDASPARGKLILSLASGRPGLVVRLARSKEFFDEFQKERGELVKVFDMHLGDQMAFSEEASREPATVVSLLQRLLSLERAELLNGLAATDERARFLRSLLDKLSLIESTTVNRRLVVDSVFVELATRAS